MHYIYMHTYHSKVSLQIDLPIGDLLGNHLCDKSSLHALLDKLAESVVRIRSIENNVSHVIEHTNEALKGEERKHHKQSTTDYQNLAEGHYTSASKIFYYNSSKQL